MAKELDEFEKRMHLSSFITTLADVVTKMNPIMLAGKEGRDTIEGAGLKDQYQSAIKKWLDMLMAYITKATELGSKYPIEELLGVKKPEE